MIITDKDIKHCASRNANHDDDKCVQCAFFMNGGDMESIRIACYKTWDFVEYGTPFTSNHTHIKDVV